MRFRSSTETRSKPGLRRRKTSRQADLFGYFNGCKVEDPNAIGLAVMLEWFDGKPADKICPREHVCDFGIRNPNGYGQELLRQGYLREETIQEKLMGFKADELKGVLRSHGLKVSGRKNELAERTAEGLSEQEIGELLRDRPEVFRMMEKGKA